MIKVFIAIVFLIVPLFLLYLNIVHPNIGGRYIFSVFALFIMAERIWETFFTSKEKNVRQFHGDWTLMLTSLIYFFTCLLIIIEFFYIDRERNLFILSLGILVFLLSAFIRYWAVKTLGNQWAIHAVGESKIQSEKHILIKNGPYKYIRHPIYLGTILELTGIALISNTYFVLFFILFIDIPLYIIRAVHEEKTSMLRFGNDYMDYIEKTSFMIPLKFPKKR